MMLYGNRDQQNNAPSWVTDSATGKTGQDEFGNTVFAIDNTEVASFKGIHAGWVRIVAGTGNRAGRIMQETLVALRDVQGDAIPGNDFLNSSSVTGLINNEFSNTQIALLYANFNSIF